VPYRPHAAMFDPMMFPPPPFGPHPMMFQPPPHGMLPPPPPQPMLDPGVLFTPFGPVHPSDLMEKRHRGKKRKNKGYKRSKSLERFPPPFMMPPPPPPPMPFMPFPPPEMMDGGESALVPFRSQGITMLPMEMPQMYGHMTPGMNGHGTKNGKLSIADSIDKSVSSTTKLAGGKKHDVESACYVLCCKGFTHVIWVIIGIILVGLILGLVLGLTLV